MGMSYIDRVFLKRKNIVDGRIKFQQKKTSKIYAIKITEQMKAILKFYLSNKNKMTLYFLC